MNPNNNMAGMPTPQSQPVTPPAEPNPVEQALQEAPAEPVPAPAPMGAPVKKSGKGAFYGMIIFAILAIAGIGFGVYMMMENNNQKSNYESQIANLKKQNAELLDKLAGEQEEEEEETEADEYITIEKFGIKIKKSSEFPNMVATVTGDNSFMIKESTDAAEMIPTSVSLMKVYTCNDEELLLGYSAKIEINGTCYVMGEMLPYGQDPEYPLTPFLLYVRDASNYSAL